MKFAIISDRAAVGGSSAKSERDIGETTNARIREWAIEYWATALYWVV